MRTILAFIMAVLPLFGWASARECYAEGTKFCEEVHYAYPPFDVVYYTYTLGAEMQLNGKTAYAITLTYSNSLDKDSKGFVAKEDNRVWYARNEESPWTLLYDFNLRIGEQCDVVCDWRQYTVTCTDISLSDDYKECETMTITTEIPIYGACDIQWLKGICSVWGLFDNVNEMLDGKAGSKIYSVTLADGTVVCSRGTDAIEKHVADAPYCVSVEGNSIFVSGAGESAEVKVYDVSGRVAAIGRTGCSIDVPHPGIFIVECDDKTRKVTVM